MTLFSAAARKARFDAASQTVARDGAGETPKSAAGLRFEAGAGRDGAPGPATGAAVNTLLVYDDDPNTVEMIARIAESRDFRGIRASTQDEFWAAYEAAVPGSIVLDLVLDGTSGVSVLRELAARDCRVPILLISGYHPEILSSALRVGGQYGLDVRGVLQKPFQMADLVDHLNHLRN